MKNNFILQKEARFRTWLFLDHFEYRARTALRSIRTRLVRSWSGCVVVGRAAEVTVVVSGGEGGGGPADHPEGDVVRGEVTGGTGCCLECLDSPLPVSAGNVRGCSEHKGTGGVSGLQLYCPRPQYLSLCLLGFLIQVALLL